MNFVDGNLSNDCDNRLRMICRERVLYLASCMHSGCDRILGDKAGLRGRWVSNCLVCHCGTTATRCTRGRRCCRLYGVEVEPPIDMVMVHGAHT